MRFKRSATFGLTYARDAAASPSSHSHADLGTGSRITLCPDIENFESELYAEVVEVEGDSLRVRALHDVYVDVTLRVLRFGDEFRVTHADVFAVRKLKA